MRMSVCVVAALLYVCSCADLTHAYYVRYLNVTASTLLTNRRLQLAYVRCFVNEGPCPPQARDIKKLLPELLTSSCSKCDVKLRQVFERCKQLIEEKFPKKWCKWSKMFTSKYSPNAL